MWTLEQRNISFGSVSAMYPRRKKLLGVKRLGVWGVMSLLKPESLVPVGKRTLLTVQTKLNEFPSAS